jgi:hypothetical protein
MRCAWVRSFIEEFIKRDPRTALARYGRRANKSDCIVTTVGVAARRLRLCDGTKTSSAT